LFKDVISNIAFAPALAAILLCVCLSRGWMHRLLSTAPFQLCGEISYSVYMWSFLVLRLFPPKPVPLDFSLRDLMPAVSDAALEIVMTTALAYGSYHLIEAPARKWLRIALLSRWRGRSAADVGGQASAAPALRSLTPSGGL
jgi:peptidoglycan/LPS O-acetylase OafA/YrhL